MTIVTREMIGAAHDVMLAKGDFVQALSPEVRPAAHFAAAEHAQVAHSKRRLNVERSCPGV